MVQQTLEIETCVTLYRVSWMFVDTLVQAKCKLCSVLVSRGDFSDRSSKVVYAYVESR